jgi:hypothetical protein
MGRWVLGRTNEQAARENALSLATSVLTETPGGHLRVNNGDAARTGDGNLYRLDDTSADLSALADDPIHTPLLATRITDDGVEGFVKSDSYDVPDVLIAVEHTQAMDEKMKGRLALVALSLMANPLEDNPQWACELVCWMAIGAAATAAGVAAGAWAAAWGGLLIYCLNRFDEFEVTCGGAEVAEVTFDGKISAKFSFGYSCRRL